MLAELRHGNAAQRKRRRILAQRDALERAERVARDEGTPGGGDRRVHGDRLPDEVWFHTGIDRQIKLLKS
jgi:hypothetical protein